VRIEDGAIQVAGSAFPGYLGQSAVQGAEWLDTGDLGHLDEDGFLFVTGRRKHVLITGYGRNVSPEWVESELSLEPAIAQAMVLGEAQPFLAAVVVPARGAANEAVAGAIERANARLPDYARVRRFVVSREPFAAAGGTLTDNGRLRRDAIVARHAEALDLLFADRPHTQTTDPAHEVL
jgi:long-subunit acyl-CoA synthetase (AMP-forming)